MCVCVCVCGKFCSLDCIYSPISSPLLLSFFSPPSSLSLFLPDFSLSPFLLLPSLLSLSLYLPDFSPLLPLSSHRECPKRRVSQPHPRGNVPAQEGVPRVIGETPSRCCPLCLPGNTEERVLWTARTKWYCGLIPIPLPLWPHSHSSSIVASFPFFFHCGLVPILLPLWPRSHSSSIVASFPFHHDPSPIPLHSHSQCYNFGGIFVILISSCLRCWQDYADLSADGTVRANTGESQDCWL